MPQLTRLLTLLLVAAVVGPGRAKYDYSPSDDRYNDNNPSLSPFEKKCQIGVYGNDNYYDGGYWMVDNDLSQKCKTQTSNAHGTFTSKGTCTFRFHKVANDTVASNRMSSACTDDNTVDEDQNGAEDDPIEQEVSLWPDACVGDFRRCYMMDRDAHIVMPHLCRHKVSVPDGTTHVSVDCTADKVRQLAQHSHAYAIVAGVIAGVLVCLCSCLAFCKRCFFQPYLNAMKSSRTDYRYTDVSTEDEGRALSRRGLSFSEHVTKAQDESSTCASETEFA